MDKMLVIQEVVKFLNEKTYCEEYIAKAVGELYIALTALEESSEL